MKRTLSLLLALMMIISVFVVVPTTVEAAEDYRAWAQRDSRWSSIRLGSSPCTIGSDGCLVSSVTKLIIQAGFRSADSFNIGTLANWLNSNGGYTSEGYLYWAKPSACVSGFNYYGNLLDYGTYNSSTYNSQLISWVNSGYHITLQVSNGNHWIAIDEAKTKATGQVYIMDSSDGVNADLTLSSRYGTFNSAVAYTGGSSPNLDPDTHYGAEGINFDGTNASNISFFNASIGCWMRNPNSYNIRSYGFYLGTNQDNLVQYTIGKNVKWTDSYIQANLSDYVGRLSQGMTYYYRFFSLTDGYNLSPVYSFTTSGNSTVTFDNIVSSNIDNDNMSIECWARNHQGLNINKYGLYYGTSVNGMNECIEVGNNVSWTDFHINIRIIDQNIEFKPNTTYYYQFFALTDGWNFSNVSSFTTGDYLPTEPPIILLGDVDCDDEVTIIDATCIQRKLANIPIAKFIETAADADEDGGFSIIDATAIQRWLAQLPSNENIGKPSIT